MADVDFDLDSLEFKTRKPATYTSILGDYELDTYEGMKAYLTHMIDKQQEKADPSKNIYIKTNKDGQMSLQISVNKMPFYWKYDAKKDVGIAEYPINSVNDGETLLAKFVDQMENNTGPLVERVKDAAAAYGIAMSRRGEIEAKAKELFEADHSGKDFDQKIAKDVATAGDNTRQMDVYRYSKERTMYMNKARIALKYNRSNALAVPA